MFVTIWLTEQKIPLTSNVKWRRAYKMRFKNYVQENFHIRMVHSNSDDNDIVFACPILYSTLLPP